MRKSFKDSIKAVEADVQRANALASNYRREEDDACFQMRLSYSPCAHVHLSLVQWTDCRLAGALGLIRILIYKAYKNGKTTMYVKERKASLREFYGVIFPSLLQLRNGINDSEERKQREQSRSEATEKAGLSEVEIEREEECAICMEMNTTKVVLPSCSHSLCLKCFKNWRAKSESCPFCRDNLKRMKSIELWICTSSSDITDSSTIAEESLNRLFVFIEKLPIVDPRPKAEMVPRF